MIIVTGLSVTVLILSRSGWPQPGFLVSTTTTPVGGDEDGTVSAAAAHHEQVVFELIDLDHARRGLPRGSGLGLLQRVDGHGQRAGREQNAEHHLSFH